MRKPMFVASVAFGVLVFCTASAHAEFCKYTDADGNAHFTNQRPELGWTVVYCGVQDELQRGTSSKPPGFIYPDTVKSIFEKEDEPSGKNGYKKCEISITMNAGANAEFVDLRAKVLTGGNGAMSTLTVDVVEFTVSNGIPYEPKRKPISSAKVVSNVFETTAMRQIDMLGRRSGNRTGCKQLYIDDQVDRSWRLYIGV